MNPILAEALKKLLAMFPPDLPDEVAVILARALEHFATKIIQKHIADPDFGTKMDAWGLLAESAKGGTEDDKAKASSALFALLGS